MVRSFLGLRASGEPAPVGRVEHDDQNRPPVQAALGLQEGHNPGMRLLVDACNVLHVTGVLPPEMAVGEPAELAQLIQRSR